jgi:hypothetical protein
LLRHRPACQQVPVYLDYGDSVAVFLQTIAVLGLAATVATAIFIYVYRGNPIIRGTSLTFCMLILVGILLGFSTVWVRIGEPSEARCTLFTFMEGLFFGVIMSNLLVKTWRTYKIFFFTFEIEVIQAVGCHLLAPGQGADNPAPGPAPTQRALCTCGAERVAERRTHDPACGVDHSLGDGRHWGAGAVVSHWYPRLGRSRTVLRPC